MQAVQPTELPLLNTIILLASGATATYSHHALIEGNRKNALSGLFITL
ncbi:cytochrome c oxidase subunit 3 [Brenneria sp. 4F2]|nr:cytochrome c oxidase subunit 3 [Brenneria bubanii]